MSPISGKEKLDVVQEGYDNEGNKMNAVPSMFKRLFLKFAPRVVLDPDDINHWKEKILYIFIFLSVFLVPVMGAINFPYLIGQNYWVIINIIIISYLGGLIIFFFPIISYKKRAALISFFVYAIGLSIIFSVGPFVASREYLLFFSIIASVLLGWPGAIVSILMNTVALVVIGILIKIGFWKHLFLPDDPVYLWFQVSTDQVFINICATLFVTFLFQQIEKSDREAKENAKILLMEKVKLTRAKHKLEEEFQERKQVENELYKSENQLRTIVEHSNELFFIHDTKNFLTYVSPNSEVILGYTPEEMKREWTELATDNPINLKGVETTEIAINTGKRQKPYLFESKKKDGALVLLEIDESPVTDETGKVVAVAGAARDVTLTKQTNDRLINSEKRFRDLFDAISDIIYTLDSEGCFISVNPAMCKAFDYTEDELIGRPVSDFMKPEFVPAFKSDYLELLKKQGHHEGTTIYFKKNGEKIYIEHRSALVQSEDGNFFISGTGRDITERILSVKKVAKLQEQIVQSQKMESIGTLAGGIAHDFNNILFPVLGYTEMLLHDTPEDSLLHKNLKKIYAGGIRARELVNQILTFSRQGSSDLHPMKMQPIVKEALKLIRATIPTTIEIKQDIDNDCSAVNADPTQIHQIVMNLTTNAFHAMEDTGGELKVSLKEIQLDEPDALYSEMAPGGYACLTIVDTGIGMDKELTEKIFDPFFTTKALGKGTGMGLSVVHGIVAGMRGSISIYSELGKGTKVHVYLPVEKNFSEPKETRSKEPIREGTEQLLVVDDEEAILTMERQMLERMGYQVTSCNSSSEALEVFCDNPDKFDMVITDMAMPNMSGDKLSTELIKIRPDIPILLCTGFSEAMSEEKAASLGIKGFLLKPIVMKDFFQKIREVLDKN